MNFFQYLCFENYYVQRIGLNTKQDKHREAEFKKVISEAAMGKFSRTSQDIRKIRTEESSDENL